jgi:hypothetical protein
VAVGIGRILLPEHYGHKGIYRVQKLPRAFYLRKCPCRSECTVQCKFHVACSARLPEYYAA